MDTSHPLFLIVSGVIIAAFRAGSPILLAAIGELYSEKGGVMNLGVEGMMLMGAIASFATSHFTGNPVLGLLVGMLVGGLFSLIHGVLVISIGADQTVSGVVLALLGAALSDFLGRPLIGIYVEGFLPVNIPVLSDLPLLGPLFFRHNILVYVTMLIALITWVVFRYTKIGMNIVAVGEDPRTADSVGINVSLVRYSVVFVGGALAGLGGAYMSSVFISLWTPGLTAGQGWIAVAVVCFSMWRVDRAVLGALLFGGIQGLQLRLQSGGVQVPSYILSMLPYIATILVLVLFSKEQLRKRIGAPLALGLPYHRE